jgi:hypothetical protein
MSKQFLGILSREMEVPMTARPSTRFLLKMLPIARLGENLVTDSRNSSEAADMRHSYFPYGVYIVENTLLVPVGSRLVGEAWPVISGNFSLQVAKFYY